MKNEMNNAFGPGLDAPAPKALCASERKPHAPKGPRLRYFRNSRTVSRNSL